MRKLLRSAVLAGAAAIAAVGTAVAATNEGRVMTVGLPDGSVARIAYQGDVAPKVAVIPAIRLVPVHYVEPVMVSPFALFDRIAADMDRQMAAMMQQARMVEVPAGMVRYSFVSTSTGDGTCSRSVQVTAFGGDAQPRVISSSSGDCGEAAPMPRAIPAVAKPAPRQAPAADTI